MAESHTGENLSEMLLKTVSEWDLKRDNQMPSFTTDNAFNIMNAWKIAGFDPHVRCVTHTLKADMKSYKPLETAAIFFSSEPFLKQGIS